MSKAKIEKNENGYDADAAASDAAGAAYAVAYAATEAYADDVVAAYAEDVADSDADADADEKLFMIVNDRYQYLAMYNLPNASMAISAAVAEFGNFFNELQAIEISPAEANYINGGD